MNSIHSCRTLHYRFMLAGFVLSVIGALVLLAGCTPVQRPAAVQSTSEPVTLSFAVPEPQGRTLTPYVSEFVDQVKKLSNGTIAVVPAWDPMGGDERGLVARVLAGDFDLAVIASRAWDDQNVPSLHVLQAPFLITDDALAEAVATSKVATQLLDNLSSVGAVGLTMWPEDLRHPFSELPDKPLLNPQDFQGLVMRGGTADVTIQLLKTLGASEVMLGDSGYQGAESGFLNGYTLMGKPTASGNVTFYPKFDILFGNAPAFARLSVDQQAVLRKAAAAAQAKAIAERPKEAASAAEWCKDGGAIVLASPEQLAALDQAVQPVYQQIEADPANAELIAAIRDLKAHTTPAPGAAACAPVTAAPTAAAGAPISLTTTDATLARLRLANWVYGSGSTDMYVDGQLALLGSNQRPLTHVPVGYLTGFLYLEPGKHSVAVVPNGKGLDEAMIAQDVDLEVGHRYTVGVMGQKEDDHFSPLVIDETAVLAKAGNPAVQNMMIYVNNVAGRDTVDFLEDGVGPTNIPYGGFVAAPIKSGHVDHLVVTANGGEKVPDNPGNFYELPSGGFINANAGHYPSGPTAVYNPDQWSDVNAREMFKQFGDVKVIWNEGVELKFNTFLAAMDKAGLNDLLTSGTYLIFAPTDAAFAALPKAQLEKFMADPKALGDFLRYHIVQGYYPPGSLSSSMFGVANSTVTNLQGADLKLMGNLSVNGINMPGQPTIVVANGTSIVPVTKVLAPTAP